jgi:hypothetical protein
LYRGERDVGLLAEMARYVDEDNDDDIKWGEKRGIRQ